jgi:hypothetical protein
VKVLFGQDGMGREGEFKVLRYVAKWISVSRGTIKKSLYWKIYHFETRGIVDTICRVLGRTIDVSDQHIIPDHSRLHTRAEYSDGDFQPAILSITPLMSAVIPGYSLLVIV